MQRPSSARITPVGEPGGDAAATLALTISEDGQPLNIFSTMAHHPWLLKKCLGLGEQLLNRGVIPERQREIVILRVGWNAQTKYEFGHHVIIGMKAGLTEEEIKGLAGGDHTWSDEDALLIAMADELCADDCVSDSTFAGLAKLWDEQALIELVICAGFYRMVSGFLNSFGVELDEGVAGFPE